MKRIFSGMQPTGNLHLGNYLGALKQLGGACRTAHECYYCVVDLHAITVPQDPHINCVQAVRGNGGGLYRLLASIPKKARLLVQSAVSAHTELMWILATLHAARLA